MPTGYGRRLVGWTWEIDHWSATIWQGRSGVQRLRCVESLLLNCYSTCTSAAPDLTHSARDRPVTQHMQCNYDWLRRHEGAARLWVDLRPQRCRTPCCGHRWSLAGARSRGLGCFGMLTTRLWHQRHPHATRAPTDATCSTGASDSGLPLPSDHRPCLQPVPCPARLTSGCRPSPKAHNAGGALCRGRHDRCKGSALPHTGTVRRCSTAPAASGQQAWRLLAAQRWPVICRHLRG